MTSLFRYGTSFIVITPGEALTIKCKIVFKVNNRGNKHGNEHNPVDKKQPVFASTKTRRILCCSEKLCFWLTSHQIVPNDEMMGIVAVPVHGIRQLVPRVAEVVPGFRYVVLPVWPAHINAMNRIHYMLTEVRIFGSVSELGGYGSEDPTLAFRSLGTVFSSISIPMLRIRIC